MVEELTSQNIDIIHRGLDVSARGGILKRSSLEQIDNFKFLESIHPNIYKTSQAGYVQFGRTEYYERYEKILKSSDALLLDFRRLVNGMVDTLDIDDALYDLLPYISEIVGVNFNYDIPEEKSRAIVSNAIYLWKRKGTRDNIRDWIRFLSGYGVYVYDFYKDVLVTNVWNQDGFVDKWHSNNTWSDNVNLPFFGSFHEEDRVTDPTEVRRIGLVIKIGDTSTTDIYTAIE